MNIEQLIVEAPSHGWGVWQFWVFVLSNIWIFLSYKRLMIRHFRTTSVDKWGHRIYGAFIGACGVGHLTMAVHMIAGMSWVMAMTLTHLVTAIVSEVAASRD